MTDEERLNWNVDLEVSLFHAIHSHRPVGVNRHFQMIFLHDKLNSAGIDRKISSKEIWSHLMEMYDLAALNESDGLPFPNKETEFCLPEEFTEEQADKSFPRCLPSNVPKSTDNSKLKEPVSDPIPAVPTNEPELKIASTEGKVSTSASSACPNKDTGSTSDGDGHVERPNEATSTSGARVQLPHVNVDSPKLDNRKRTRLSLHGTPAPDAATPPAASGSATPSSSTAKRSRRI